MSLLFDAGIFSVILPNSSIASGATLAWYESGTSTPLATYSDPGLTTPNPNPVTVDANGRLPPIWLQPQDYKLVFTPAVGTVVTRDPIKGQMQAADVYYNFGTVGASTRTLQAAGRDRMNINAEYSVQGNNIGGDATKIQSAIDGALIGGFVTANSDVYKITRSSWNQTRYFDWDLPQYATFRGDYTAGDTNNILNIDIATTDGSGDVRNLTFRGGKLFTNPTDASSTAGGYAIGLNTNGNTGLPVQGFMTIRSQLGGRLGAMHFYGDDTRDSVLFSGSLLSNLQEGSVLENVSDGSTFLFNLNSGTNCAHTLKARGGAFNHTFEGGSSVNTKGALDVIDGDRWFLHNMQIEQPQALNTQDLGAQVIIRGTSRPSIGGHISQCNFGEGDHVTTAIGLLNAYGTIIDEVYFGPNSATIVGSSDITLGPQNDNSIIGHRCLFRGSSRTRKATGTVTDVSRLMTVNMGVYTTRARGLWQDGGKLLDGLFDNGWSSSGLEIMQLESGMIVFNGTMAAGTLTAGTTICTFPDWLRPFADKKVMVVCADGSVHGMSITSAGVFSPLTNLTGAISLDNTFWMAPTLVPYNPGVP